MMQINGINDQEKSIYLALGANIKKSAIDVGITRLPRYAYNKYNIRFGRDAYIVERSMLDA